ncbi:NADH-quinone oxidoreductase subunit NuoK [Haloechinothrix salitolerans]|uniref:NADH-quinone oxidoreductase subunit K n=1 Tax=Haloechinothrix salitolerans TaxID=926830 RepID=A0ABW2C0W7_9PSEU
MTLELVLILAAALFSVGLFGALSQQSIVMIMMGIELMINAVFAGAAGFWYFAWPQAASGQVLVLLAMVVMAVEMAMGFAATIAVYRASQVDMTNMAADLRG